jgi:hypothetical protein
LKHFLPSFTFTLFIFLKSTCFSLCPYTLGFLNYSIIPLSVRRPLHMYQPIQEMELSMKFSDSSVLACICKFLFPFFKFGKCLNIHKSRPQRPPTSHAHQNSFHVSEFKPQYPPHPTHTKPSMLGRLCYTVRTLSQ